MQLTEAFPVNDLRCTRKDEGYHDTKLYCFAGEDGLYRRVAHAKTKDMKEAPAGVKFGIVCDGEVMHTIAAYKITAFELMLDCECEANAPLWRGAATPMTMTTDGKKEEVEEKPPF